MNKLRNVIPNPEFLIKSIAEQGYSIETAISDLIDNSISAGCSRVEILTDTESDPFKLFIVDDGEGMNNIQLFENLKFPSNSPEFVRSNKDLGRFGLGMKTASFSQTRKFTVISREKGTKEYSAFTWDVDLLKQLNEWKIIENTAEEIKEIIDDYHRLSNNLLENNIDFIFNTIVYWEGLYKYENYLSIENKIEALNIDITENTNHYLSIVFHQFLQRDKDHLTIRINNLLVNPFNPFPKQNIRGLGPSLLKINNEEIKIEGFVLPNISIKESKEKNNIWTPNNKSLMDMEGLYIYRNDRLILYSGWNGLIKKSPRLQLARLKVEIGNSVDYLFHLNVAKSQIIIPHELKSAFLKSVINLRDEAQKEYFNSTVIKFPRESVKNQLFVREATNKGVKLVLNEDFPLIVSLKNNLSKGDRSNLNFILKYCSHLINSIRNVDDDQIIVIEEDQVFLEDILTSIKELKKSGISVIQIETILGEIGIKKPFPKVIIHELE
jgi:hypothetical protein